MGRLEDKVALARLVRAHRHRLHGTVSRLGRIRIDHRAGHSGRQRRDDFLRNRFRDRWRALGALLFSESNGNFLLSRNIVYCLRSMAVRCLRSGRKQRYWVYQC